MIRESKRYQTLRGLLGADARATRSKSSMLITLSTNNCSSKPFFQLLPFLRSSFITSRVTLTGMDVKIAVTSNETKDSSGCDFRSLIFFYKCLSVENVIYRVTNKR